MNKIKKDDQVMVIKGKDRGRSAQVRQVLPKEQRAISARLRRNSRPASSRKKRRSRSPTSSSSARTAAAPPALAFASAQTASASASARSAARISTKRHHLRGTIMAARIHD